MTPNKQRIAIAEACGWKWNPANPPTDARPYYTHPTMRAEYNLPDYLNDLNAMHEAEKVLTDFQRRRHGLLLQEILNEAVVGFVLDYDRQLAGLSRVAFATAAQRAEAFLRTLNLWRDET